MPKKKQRKAKKPSASQPKKNASFAKTRPFPRRTLESALRIPRAIKEKNAGNEWAPDQVAKAVPIGAKGVDFYYVSAASRDYGLTTGTRDSASISLTELGRSVVYPKTESDEKQNKIKAFFNVELFKKVYEYYRGGTLPEQQYVSNVLVSQFDLPEDFHEEFLDIFHKNCKYLGIASGLSTLPANLNVEEIPTQVSDSDSGTVITLSANANQNAPTCFVAIPFRERDPIHPEGFFGEVLTSLIVAAGSKAGFKVTTAQKTGSDVIQATIVNDLLSADLVIADLTEHNPNVMFELGLRMAADKPVALIRAEGTPPIFDVDNMLRVYNYNPNLWQSTIKDDVEGLEEHILATWNQRESSSSYMKILRGQKQ